MAIGAYIHGTPIRRKRQLVCRVVAEQAVAVPIGGDPADQGSVYTFNESGTTLWTMIEAGGSIADLAEYLQHEYRLSGEQAAADAMEFVAELAEEGLIEPA